MFHYYGEYMKLVLSTQDLTVMECRYTAAFNIFSYAIKNDHLSIVYFKQRELLYQSKNQNGPMTDLRDSIMKNVIICMSSLMLKMNTNSISLTNY